MLLDCTLRDGGYINDWNFGYETIKGFAQKIVQTGIEIFEVGFIKGDDYDPDKTVFPDVESISSVIQPKEKGVKYVGMIDMSAPVPLDRICRCDGSSVDGIRIIFKKDRIEEAYRYCEAIQNLVYFISVNVVSTDLYTDAEFISVINKFNSLNPFAFAIVDTFGLIKRKQFMRLAYLADHNLNESISLAYHAHNNLQQAFGNAEALVEMNLRRNVVIDACVFGMGRGAGNLNLELFAEYMNDNYDTHYKIEPMLEIMDKYLNDIYNTKFWGYSLPLYLSATAGCHPNYAVYLAEKNSLTVKSFNELLRNIPDKDKVKFSPSIAEKYYREYQENYIDDRETIKRLREELSGKKVVVLAPGKSIAKETEIIKNECRGAIVIASNFLADEYSPDYIFSSNMRRFVKIQGKTKAQCIITSNMKEALQKDCIINFSSYASSYSDIIDNSVLMLLKMLISCGVYEISIAGMDGYSDYQESVYYSSDWNYDFSKEAKQRNAHISQELKEICRQMKIHFITPTLYEIGEQK